MQVVSADLQALIIALSSTFRGLGYGPLVYSVEQADQSDLALSLGDAPIAPVWHPDLLGGIVAVEEQCRDGSPMRAVPYHTWMNRTGATVPEFPAGDGTFDPSGEVAVRSGPANLMSRVWISV